jgi:hypothetical protein
MNSNTTQKVAIASIGGLVALCLGVGAYQVGKQAAAGTQPEDQTTVATRAPLPAATSSSVAPNAVMPAAAPRTAYVTPASDVPVTTPSGAPPVPPFNSTPTTTAVYPPNAAAINTPILVHQTPMLASAPAPTNTVVEKEVIYQQRPVTVHRVVVHRHTKYHHGGKVHIGRALKHTATFIAKLPGRARL